METLRGELTYHFMLPWRSVMSLVKGLLMGLVMDRSWCQSHSDQMSQVQGPASSGFLLVE